VGTLDGKVAFISGIARGQGRSHALRLAGEGADIIGVDICHDIETMDYPNATPADLAETTKLIEQLDRRVITSEADVRDYDAVRHCSRLISLTLSPSSYLTRRNGSPGSRCRSTPAFPSARSFRGELRLQC
jgi:NADP-dependent 3-hydroxy acid dehydrogenase YdfG